MQAEQKTIHPFESAGLGVAPFRFVGMSENVFVIPGVMSKPGGCCDYCSAGIRYECHVASSDGRRFKVGCDCIRKLDRADNRLLSDMEREMGRLRQKQRDDERAKKRAARDAQCQAALQAERDRNGGLTDHETRVQRESLANAERHATCAASNAWLIEAIGGMPGQFVSDMLTKLRENMLADLSERTVEVLRDIYAKQHGRRNSKAYDAACELFDAELEKV